MNIYVQFESSAMLTVISFFFSEQDETFYPNQAQIDTSDDRWRDYYESLPIGVKDGMPAPT